MKTDQPTPETDAAQHEGLLRGSPLPTRVVHVNFARRLERERDEAREQIEVCRGIIQRTVIARNSALSDLTELERERDEAREALKHIEEYGTEEINAAVELRQKLAQALVDFDNMQDQRDLAMKVIKRLERERDDVREVARAALGSKNYDPRA